MAFMIKPFDVCEYHPIGGEIRIIKSNNEVQVFNGERWVRLEGPDNTVRCSYCDSKTNGNESHCLYCGAPL